MQEGGLSSCFCISLCGLLTTCLNLLFMVKRVLWDFHPIVLAKVAKVSMLTSTESRSLRDYGSKPFLPFHDSCERFLGRI